MVKSNTRSLDRVFHALAHPTRRAILRRLEKGPRSLTELTAEFNHSLVAVSKHVRVLETAQLVRRQWHGRTTECRLEPAALRSADAWLAHYRAYWDGALGRMAALVERPRRAT